MTRTIIVTASTGAEIHNIHGFEINTKFWSEYYFYSGNFMHTFWI